MNGRLFKPLMGLRILNLLSTACISKKFKKAALQSIPEKVNAKCRFEEEEISDLGLICETLLQKVRGTDFPSSGDHCLMNGSAVIYKKDETFHFMLDRSVIGLDFNNNKKIEYLPVKVHRVFPNLKEYMADHCSIREISRKNFEKLYEIKAIMLEHNQIEKLPSDTFTELPLLLVIGLRKF